MTEFLRDIAESSKSPLQQSIESLIRERVGMMACDIIDVEKISQQIKSDNAFTSNFVYTDTRYINPVKIEATLKTMVNMRMIQCPRGRLWVIRNHNDYINLNSDQLYDEHLRQVAQCQSSTVLTPVGRVNQ